MAPLITPYLFSSLLHSAHRFEAENLHIDCSGQFYAAFRCVLGTDLKAAGSVKDFVNHGLVILAFKMAG